jgi:hypothetical protein
VLYVTMPVFIVRNELTADASLAAMRARSKFGIAIAAMIRMIATPRSATQLVRNPSVSASRFIPSSPIKKSFGLSGPNWRYVRHFIGQRRKLPLGRLDYVQVLYFQSVSSRYSGCTWYIMQAPAQSVSDFCSAIDNLCHFGTVLRHQVNGTNHQALLARVKECKALFFQKRSSRL